ncbi:MAG: RNA polymerase sigma factor, partial [Singulisphaera sp.]
GTLRVRDSVAPWLHQVAYRTSACARSTASRRKRHERRAAEMAARSVADEGPDDVGEVLHEEVGRLPERYRAVFVLCGLEGLTHQQAARHLGWPVGTVQSRLARGRERLRGRLMRRGVMPSAGLLAAASPATPSRRKCLPRLAGRPSGPRGGSRRARRWPSWRRRPHWSSSGEHRDPCLFP